MVATIFKKNQQSTPSWRQEDKVCWTWKLILKEDRSLDAFNKKRLWEKFQLFWTPKESGYLMKHIGVKDDLRRGVRNVQKGQKGDSQRRKVSWFFKDLLFECMGEHILILCCTGKNLLEWLDKNVRLHNSAKILNHCAIEQGQCLKPIWVNLNIILWFWFFYWSRLYPPKKL